MINKPVLMIHKISDWMFDLPLEDYVLTFDDGLFNQFCYLDQLKRLKTEKIFFISTNIVCPEDQNQLGEFPESVEAHETYFKRGDKRHFMKWTQIEEIARTPNCTIGGHSHFHQKVLTKSLSELYQLLTSDTDLMMAEFESKKMKVTKFCFPYNDRAILYTEILSKKGFTEFYGAERIAVESLRHECRH